MLATLIHSTLVSDSQTEKGEENRKHYQNLIKKLKKVKYFRKLTSTLFILMLFLGSWRKTLFVNFTS